MDLYINPDLGCYQTGLPPVPKTPGQVFWWSWLEEREEFTREFKLEAIQLIKDRGIA